LSRNQRIALLAVAALIAVAAFVALQPDDDRTTAANSQATPAPETTTTTPSADDRTTRSEEEPKRKAKRKPPLLIAGQERTLTYTKGELVRFRVRHPSAEEVHVHGYDVKKDVPGGRTVTVTFPAELEGIFEVELERSHTPLGSIRVEP
jgi:hypothetical protein